MGFSMFPKSQLRHRVKSRGIVSFFSQPTLPAIPLGSGACFVFVFSPGEMIVGPTSGDTELAGLGGRVMLSAAVSDP